MISPALRKTALAVLVGTAAFFVGGLLAPEAKPTPGPSSQDATAPIPDEPAEPLLKRHAFMMEKAFYDSAFDAAEATCPPETRGVIVNHHLLAKTFIAEALGCLDPETPVVVLIAPNHFSAGGKSILMSKATWITPYGDLPAAADLIYMLAGRGYARVEEEPFEKEHGIGNIVAFIRRAAPNARVLPIILKDSADPGSVGELAADLKAILPEGASVVASLDFSHELTPVAARHADARSLRVISSGKMPDLDPMDVDSVPGLRLVLRTMKLLDAPRFTLLHRSGSAEVTGQDPEDTTSYIVGAFTRGEPEAPRMASYLALGDVMLDRDVKARIDKLGVDAVLGQTRRLLLGSDGVVANFEGAVSASPSPPDEPAHPTFVVEDELLYKVRAQGFSHFTLANNHARDAGTDGMSETRRLLKEAGFASFGDFENREALSHVEEVGGMRIAFVGYHAFRPGLENVLTQIRLYDTEADAVVVMAHWGEEYRTTPTSVQREAARKLVEAGADVVLGAHPHVIQPVEIVDGRPVFWSLGNFLFDQLPPATRTGLAVGMRFTPDAMSFSLIPTETDGQTLRLAPKERRDTILEMLGHPSGEFILPIDAYERRDDETGG